MALMHADGTTRHAGVIPVHGLSTLTACFSCQVIAGSGFRCCGPPEW